MRIKALIIACVLLLGTVSAALAQVDSTQHFQGVWEVKKVAVKIYAQRGGQLLEDKIVTDENEIRQIAGIIKMFSANGDNCMMQFSSAMRDGTFRIVQGKIVFIERGQTDVVVTYPYHFEGTLFWIELPGTYMNSTQHQMPVKQFVSCQFQKKP